MQLGHYPKTLIDDLMRKDKLNTLPAEGGYILLRQLIQFENTNLALYNVLWDRLLSDDKVHSKRCASIINLIYKFQKLQPA
jgi:hypothetical protein